MPVKVKVIPKNTLYLAVYEIDMLSYGILNVSLVGGQRTKPRPSIGGLYPVNIDLFDDGSLMNLEIFLKTSPSYEKKGLETPSSTQNAQLIIIEDDVETTLPIFWINRQQQLLFVEAIRKPKVPIEHIQIAEQITADIDSDSNLAGLWLVNLPPEVFGSLSNAETSRTTVE